MSVLPGNDPFSGTNTKNILQHIISPKIVDTGSGAHAVKLDVINIDDMYVTDTLLAKNVNISGDYNTPPSTITMKSSFSSSFATEDQNAPPRRMVVRGTTPSTATSFQIFSIGQYIAFGTILNWTYRDEDGNLAWGFFSKISGNIVAPLEAGVGNTMSGTATTGGVTITLDTLNNVDGIKITTNNTSKTYIMTVNQMNLTV